MAYSLTVAGYEFENPPEEYRKLARLSNSPQTAIGKESTAFFQSDSQDLQFQVEGTLALDPPLGETQDDLDELERLQDIAIEGGEVEIQFDPFFSGQAVIEDDPFRQQDGESSYQFTFSVNSEDTDSSAYPAHSTPETGNTFEFGDLDLGYDPNQVQQNYERQTEKVKRLSGIARTVDNDGLIPKIQISGLIDGGGQAELWEKARDNVLAYLNAEFQNGWALLDQVSIRNAPEAPDYLTGLFRYDADLLIVMDPASGIGETTKYVDQNVKESTQYVSDCDGDGEFERLGDNTEDYPYALDYRISGGTGKLNGDYLEWQEDYGTLEQSATNYIWIEDPDGNGYGQVNTGISGFPGNAVPLWEVDTSTSSVDAIRDQRSCLTGSRDPDTGFGDLNFTDDMELDDRLLIEQILALPPDQMAVSDPIERWLGLAEFTDQVAVSEMDPIWQRIVGFTDPFSMEDGGSALSGSTSEETLTWGTTADWDSAVDEFGVVHEPFGAYAADELALGYPSYDLGGSAKQYYWPLQETSGSTANEVTNGNDGTYQDSPNLGVDAPGPGTGMDLSASSSNSNSAGYVETGLDDAFPDPASGIAWVWPGSSNDEHNPWGEYDGDGGRIWRVNYQDSYQVWPASGAGSNPSRQNWHMVGFRRNGSNVDYWWDSSSQGSASDLNDNPSSVTAKIGQRGDGDYYSDGYFALVQVWGRELSDQEFLDHYNVFQPGGGGYITTGTKSFSSDVEPDLQNLDYTLNGGTITVDVIGSPGTASEETRSVTLDGSTSYDLTWNTSHTDYRLKISLDPADLLSSPVFRTGELEAITSGGVGSDNDQNPNTHWEIRGATYDRSGNEYEGGGITSRYGAD